MVEYNVEALVKLYDSLTNQIAEVSKDIADSNNLLIEPTLPVHIEKQIRKNLENLNERLVRLIEIRNKAEILFNRLLGATINE